MQRFCVQTRNSTYVIEQDDAGNHKFISSTNPNHQHVGCPVAALPSVGDVMLTQLESGKTCVTSIVREVTPIPE